MREKLKNIGNEERHTFTGEFVRFGEKKAYKGHKPDITVLLSNVKDEKGQVLTDHLWMSYTKGFESCDLKKYDIVQFDARVAVYEKGYKGHREWDEWQALHPVSTDYKLSHPTKVKVIGTAEGCDDM